MAREEGFFGKVGKFGRGFDVKVREALKDAVACERECCVGTVDEGEVREVIGPSGEHAEGCDSGTTAEIDGVRGLGANVSEGEFGEERVPFPSDSFAGEAFIKGESVRGGPVIGFSGAAFEKGVT